MQVLYFTAGPDKEFPLPVEGWNHHQQNINSVGRFNEIVGKEEMGYLNDKFRARLILEDDNKYDLGNAVRVEIDSKLVGYLSRDNAKIYRKSLIKLGQANVIGECKAGVAGRREALGKPMVYRVWLDMLPWKLQIDESRK
ncbi:MAG TPA: hypothetical protein VIN60_06390 [Anaerolineales bacterium]